MKKSSIECRLDKIEERLTRLEEKLTGIIQNEFPHIWKFLWILLGSILSILGAVILQIILK